VQASGLNVVTDPVFSHRASPVRFAGPARVYPTGLSIGKLPHIDVVVISHNHYDHLDRGSILALCVSGIAHAKIGTVSSRWLKESSVLSEAIQIFIGITRSKQGNRLTSVWRPR
jgi:L-ascorbate metabolism protein UlaG (beta-lactamase superfamily)